MEQELKIIDTNKYKIKCQDCKDYMTIYIGEGQVIFDITVTHWRLWSRIKYAFWILFKRKEYGGAVIWITPKKFKNLLKKLNENNYG